MTKFITYLVMYSHLTLNPKDVSRSGGKKIGYSFKSKINKKFGYKNPKGHIVEFGGGMC